jgi:hypothetical protein
MALTFPRSRFRQLRISSVHGSSGEGMDVSAPRGRTAAGWVALEVERPGSELDGLSVIVYSVLTHPHDGRPGIAYARESPRLVAHGLDGDPAGRSTSPTRRDSMSVQGGAQEPESPDQPDEQIPGQPGTMPDDDPSPVPEPPDMPSDPDRDPSQLPPDESGSS